MGLPGYARRVSSFPVIGNMKYLKIDKGKAMKIKTSMRLLLILLLLASCNMPSKAPPATPTKLLPTATKAPPTATPTEELPTEEPTAIPPTATLEPPTPQPIPPTRAATATAVVIKPQPGALFSAQFVGGGFSFRIHGSSNYVIPKIVNVKKAQCAEGKTVSDQISFEPPPTFEIKDNQFTITQGTQVTIYGTFTSATTARGTITLKFKGKGVACTVGPLGWNAVATSQ
jgi:hypothetical protein